MMKFAVMLLLVACLVSCSEKGTGTLDGEDTNTGLRIRPVLSQSPVRFNEVDAHNLNLEDFRGEDPPWVEFYNPTDTAVNLAGLALARDREEPNPWVLGNIWINPGGYAIVFLSEIDTLPSASGIPDTVDLIGNNIWGWADAQNTPESGGSTVSPWAFSGYRGFIDGMSAFSAVLNLADNSSTLGWRSSCLFVGFPPGGNPRDTIDLRAHNILLLTGELEEGKNLQVRIAQRGIPDWEGWFEEITGDGRAQSQYEIFMPKGTNFPDLARAYGVRFSPPETQLGPVHFTFTRMQAVRSHQWAHAAINLRRNGGALWLMNSQGILDSIVYPATPRGGSYGLDSTRRFGHLSVPTPGQSNRGVAVERFLPAVQSVVPPGFYAQPIWVVLQPVPNAQVRYTLDGSKPTENSPLYQNPLRIEVTTTIRYAAFSQNALSGPVQGGTYFIGEQTTLAVVSLTADPLQLFDPDSGIYMMGPDASSELPFFGANFWQDKELEASVDFFEEGGRLAWSAPAGLKIFGNWSRAQPKKSWSINFREKYGMGSLQYPLWGQPLPGSIRSFILRNGGNNAHRDHIRDALAHEVAATLGIERQKSRPVLVYINGQYWGIYNLRDKLNAKYFETNFGLDRRKIDLIKPANEVQAGSNLDYRDLEQFVEDYDPADQTVMDEINRRMDVFNFLDYNAAQIYFNNTDWPANNIKRWRFNDPPTRWRWALYDVDFGFANFHPVEFDMYPFVTATDGDHWPNGPQSTLLLRRLLRNSEFRTAFINRQLYYLSNHFSAPAVLAKAESMWARVAQERPRDLQRWGLSSDVFSENDAQIRDFILRRPALVRGHLAEFFNLETPVSMRLGWEGNGRVLLHGFPVIQGTSAVFFAEQPLLLEAVPAEGAIFRGWSDGETSARRIVIPMQGELKALF